MTQVFILFLLTLGLILFIIPFIIHFYYYLKHTDDKKSTPARVIYKAINFTGEVSVYIIVFELYTGNKLSFNVKSHQYSQYNIGDKGILTYKENKFVYFKKKY